MCGVGVEIEFTGVMRSEVVLALEGLFHTKASSCVSKTTEDNYIFHKIEDEFGGVWTVKRDRSITPQVYAYKVLSDYVDNKFDVVYLEDNFNERSAYMVELVSPVLTSVNISVLFSVIDVIKSIGGIVNESCGMHIHVDSCSSGSSDVDMDYLSVLFNKFVVEQERIFKDFKVKENRIERYCKRYDSSVPTCKSFDSVMSFLNYLYYNQHNGMGELRELRYFALNFYALKQHGTIEFRFFNSTLDKTEVARNIDWVLHFAYSFKDYIDYLPVLGSVLLSSSKEGFYVS